MRVHQTLFFIIVISTLWKLQVSKRFKVRVSSGYSNSIIDIFDTLVVRRGSLNCFELYV